MTHREGSFPIHPHDMLVRMYIQSRIFNFFACLCALQYFDFFTDSQVQSLVGHLKNYCPKLDSLRLVCVKLSNAALKSLKALGVTELCLHYDSPLDEEEEVGWAFDLVSKRW